MLTTAVFDTKPYDREQLERSSAHRGIAWRFLEFRLTKDRPCPEGLDATSLKNWKSAFITVSCARSDAPFWCADRPTFKCTGN